MTIQWNRRTGVWERTGPEMMLVPHTSAVYAGKNEKVYDQIPIDADNSNIVKFGDPSEHYYLIVERRLKDLVAEAPSVIKERFMSHSKSEFSRNLGLEVKLTIISRNVGNGAKMHRSFEFSRVCYFRKIRWQRSFTWNLSEDIRSRNGSPLPSR